MVAQIDHLPQDKMPENLWRIMDQNIFFFDTKYDHTGIFDLLRQLRLNPIHCGSVDEALTLKR